MSHLSTRVDDWSFQITAANSARFFVRVTSSTTNEETVVFSDFVLNPDDDTRAVDALHLLKERGFPLASAVTLVFQDIFPSYRGSNDHAELVRRHDQIVAVVKDYSASAGATITKSALNSNLGKFETVVLIE